MRTLEEIEKDIERAQEDYDKKWYADNTNMSWVEFKKWAEPEIRALDELSRERRMTMSYKLNDIPSYADVMKLIDFIECVKEGVFIDYDGDGRYCIDGKETDIEIYPSDVNHGAIRWEFDSVAWYNK